MPYFDHNATTPLAPVARDAWLRAQAEHWHNPASPYREAARARLKLEAARAALGRLVEAASERVVFTSGATESANAIVRHLAATLEPSHRVAVNPTEHACVLASLGAFFPGRIVPLPITPDGVVTPAALSRCLADAPAASPIRAVVTMAANHETGVIQPWSDLARVAEAAGATFVCDAAQWLGKLPAAGLGRVPWVLGSAHKFGGPKGVGFLLRAESAEGFRGQVGGEQQRGHRGGTEDYPGAAALVAALSEAEQTQVMFESERLAWREEFERTVIEAVPGARVLAAGADRLWNTVTLILPEPEQTRWVAWLDKRGFQVATGSACSTGRSGPSHVLAALGVPPEESRRAVRVSAGWSTTRADWLALAEAWRLAAQDQALRSSGGVISLGQA